MDWYEEAVRQHGLLGTREFYVPLPNIIGLLRRVLASCARPRISINRPHVGGRSLVHSVEWGGLRFISVTHRPIVVS